MDIGFSLFVERIKKRVIINFRRWHPISALNLRYLRGILLVKVNAGHKGVAPKRFSYSTMKDVKNCKIILKFNLGL